MNDRQVYRGFSDTPHIQERLRLYSQTSQIFRLIALRQAYPLSLLTVISEKFGTVSADMITDWKFRYQEMNEPPADFTLASASVRPASGSLIDYISVPNSVAPAILPTYRLSCDKTFMGRDLSGGATTTNVGTTFDVTNRPLNEVVRVVGIGEPSSAYESQNAVNGYTWVKIMRAHPAVSVTGQLAAIPAGATLTIVNNVSKTNSGPNPPVSSTGYYLENVIQISRESYGIGEHQAQGGGIKTLLLEDGAAQLDLNLEMTQLKLLKTIEMSIVRGRRFAAEYANESEYETGGILEFIPQSNYLDIGGVLNISRINYIIAQALEISGVRELWWFTGSTLTQALAEAFENKRGFGQNTQLTVNYRMKVNEIESTGRDGIVYHVNAPVLTRLGMGDKGLILNLTEYNYGEKNPYGAFQIAEKVPLLDLPENDKSYGSNQGFRGIWRELYYAYGLVRRLQSTHLLTYGLVS